ncbi:MAG TPA: ferrous iron transport protein A [Candidatus Limadaptatus stercorigallinarum]|uniref:Ferrous iron transport protein A n=1 Tax=Candidatus Limadaptatus stercorigallinarum TaxID=2840845 RepID=A0A9D1L338_9FIRM|nr:FeoA family protein [Christensenellales bacterium]HIU21518.1 ferrous iron transport protein A [Candidatus Limadaptatus stercorigallinarum]
MPLVFAPVNVLLRVVKMHVDEKLKRHLENLGISVNSELEVLSQSGGSVICRIKDGRLALDRDMATRIFVAVKEA